MCDRNIGPQRADEYIDGILEHDGDVGTLLKTVDDLGIADNTIVINGTTAACT